MLSIIINLFKAFQTEADWGNKLTYSRIMLGYFDLELNFKWKFSEIFWSQKEVLHSIIPNISREVYHQSSSPLRTALIPSQPVSSNVLGKISCSLFWKTILSFLHLVRKKLSKAAKIKKSTEWSPRIRLHFWGTSFIFLCMILVFMIPPSISLLVHCHWRSSQNPSLCHELGSLFLYQKKKLYIGIFVNGNKHEDEIKEHCFPGHIRDCLYQQQLVEPSWGGEWGRWGWTATS